MMLKQFSFGLLVLTMLVLAAATVVEKCLGTDVTAARIYASWWFAALWAALAAMSLAYLLQRRVQRRRAVLLLHLSFIVILAGAAATRCFGRQGTIHLRTGEEPTAAFTDRNGAEHPLPFAVRLDDFRVVCYDGTRAPMDFVSSLTLLSEGDTRCGEVAMNRILAYRNYRFYQSGYDADGRGATLALSHDPWGIGITYAGYLLLLGSLAGFFFDGKSRFRQLLRGMFCLLFLYTGMQTAQAAAANRPHALPRDVAEELGGLYVCYNDRICPLATLARDVTVKLCGKARYKGYTPEQVLSGWLFYYDDWKREPMIRIKDAGVRRRMGLAGRYAALVDFRGADNEYLLSETGRQVAGDANEKFGIVSLICTGSMLRLFPYTDPQDGTLRWASQVDALPRELAPGQRLFIGRAMNYVNELVVHENWDALREVLRKIRAYQQKEGGASLPSAGRFRAERFYNRIEGAFPAAGTLILAGLAAFVYVCRQMLRGRPCGRPFHRLAASGLAAGFLYLSLTLGLRGYVCGHWPLSNGYETMQFMAWFALLAALILRRRFIPAIPFGFLVAGLAMTVSGMSGSNPQITPLMPVLSSPLLSVHVMLVMVAYSLLAFAMCNGITGLLLLRRHRAEALRLQRVGTLLLYPAVFTLAAGIFVGAVWANVSWGRYWGWDPKEVWALITLLVYCLPLHADSLEWFRHPAVFHAFCTVAFLSVLVTYFGVNFLLGGMHSYA